MWTERGHRYDRGISDSVPQDGGAAEAMDEAVWNERLLRRKALGAAETGRGLLAPVDQDADEQAKREAGTV